MGIVASRFKKRWIATGLVLALILGVIGVSDHEAIATTGKYSDGRAWVNNGVSADQQRAFETYGQAKSFYESSSGNRKCTFSLYLDPNKENPDEVTDRDGGCEIRYTNDLAEAMKFSIRFGSQAYVRCAPADGFNVAVSEESKSYGFGAKSKFVVPGGYRLIFHGGDVHFRAGAIITGSWYYNTAGYLDIGGSDGEFLGDDIVVDTLMQGRIIRKTPTFQKDAATAVNLTDVTYGSTLGSLKYDSNPGAWEPNTTGTWTFTDPGIVPAVGTHTYSMTFTPVDCFNYNPVTVKDAASVTVNKRTVKLSDYSPLQLQYGQSVRDITPSNVCFKDSRTGDAVEGQLDFRDPNYTPAIVGREKIRGVFTPTSADYEAYEGEFDLDVTPCTPQVQTAPQQNNDIEAGKTLASVNLSGGVCINPYSHALVPGGWTWKEASTVLSAGKSEYTAIFTPGSAMYRSIEVAIPVTVKSAAAAPTASPGKNGDGSKDGASPKPSASPSASPSVKPSVSPSASPSVSPSVKPSASPSASPSVKPSASPTVKPSTSPSASPSASPGAATGPAASSVEEPEIEPPIVIEKIVSDISDITSSDKPGKVKIKNANRSGDKVVIVVKKIQGVRYQVQFATSKKNWKKAKKKNFKKATITLKGLKQWQTYYVRIRAFKKVGKKTVYGKWSKVKKI